MLRNACVSLLAVAVMTLASTEIAHAKEVSITGTFTPAQIKSTCSKVGGNYTEGGGGYGCENPKKSTSVYCRDGKCTGYVPEKRAGGATSGLTKSGTPEAILLNEASPPAVAPRAPTPPKTAP